MQENKKEFIKKLHNLISENTAEYSDITDMTYVQQDNMEWLYVSYKSHSQKRINISSDSCSQILKDFVNKVEETPWLRPSEMIYANFE